jgi:hypothetical protein
VPSIRADVRVGKFIHAALLTQICASLLEYVVERTHNFTQEVTDLRANLINITSTIVDNSDVSTNTIESQVVLRVLFRAVSHISVADCRDPTLVRGATAHDVDAGAAKHFCTGESARESVC